MKELYLIIKCGYEGIEELLCPTTNPEEAKENILALRKKIVDAKAERDKHGEAEWDQMLEDKKISYDYYSLGEYEDPDSYCVQKWTGENFECCCPELGVEPTKTWLM